MGSYKKVMAYHILLSSMFLHFVESSTYCGSSNGVPNLEYVIGDAMRDSPDCIGPTGQPYPINEMRSLLPKFKEATSRQGRAYQFNTGLQSPERTREELLAIYSLTKTQNFKGHFLTRAKRAANETTTPATTTSTSSGTTEKAEENQNKINVEALKTTCTDSATPSRLCRSTFNTTAPMYGVSLTSGKPVTVVQIFPDLLQQVVYETCDSKQCDLIHGECVQTYVPYLFLVIPLGPVTLTGQDYVLVESGCSCRPKYAAPGSDPNPTSVIPNY